MPSNKKSAANSPQQSKPNADAITTKIIAEFKDRQRAEIKKWRSALAVASDPENQRLYVLQDLYDNLKSDGHFLSQVELRKSSTLCRSFSIIDRATGAELPEKSAFFRRQWFYDFMEDVLDSTTRGFVLLEIVDTASPRFVAIPRRNTVPLKSQIVIKVQDDKGIDYRPFIGRTLIQVGSPDELGLMAELCGQLIWKRNAQQSWAEHSERFGFPLITATTNKSSDADIARIRKMLEALGEASQAVLPEGTTLDIKAATTGDAYMVYDKQIGRINTELSKALNGGTMISDDGSSRSQSEVHERNLDDKIAARDRRIVTFIVNDQLIPMLALWGHQFNPLTDAFQFDQTYDLTVKEHWDIVSQATQQYDIPTEWISKTFNIPITGVKTYPTTETAATAIATPGGFTANFR